MNIQCYPLVATTTTKTKPTECLPAVGIKLDEQSLGTNPLPTPLSLVHFQKTGGTALALWIEQHGLPIEHNSLPGKCKRKHMTNGFDNVDVVTIVRSPIAMAVSQCTFGHSGSEFSHLTSVSGGHKNPLSEANLRKVVLQRIHDEVEGRKITPRTKLNDFLCHRATLTHVQTHILCTDLLTEGAAQMCAALNLGPHPPVQQQHVSNHAPVDTLFTSAEIEHYNSYFPELTKTWRQACANGGYITI